MKKILVIATTKITVDGLTKVLLNVSRIAAENYPVGIAIGEGSDEELFPELEKLGTVYQLPSRKKNTLRYIRTLTAIIRDNNYDTVHIHGNSATMAWDLIAATVGGATTRITHCHNCAKQPWLKQKTLGKIFNKLVTTPVACSNAAGREMYSKPYTVLVNGIKCENYRFSTEKRETMRKQLHIENAFVVGHVGRFSKQKNHVRLISIFAEILKQRSEAVLLLSGDGEEREKIEQISQNIIPSGHIVFCGNVQDIQDYYSAMDVFVLPSLFEGLPLVGIEAQASGLPCFFSDSITRETGLLPSARFLPLKESDSVWADEICKCNAADRENAADLVRNAGFSEAAFIEQVKKLYEIAK